MQEPKKSVSLRTLFVVIISTLIVAFLLFRNFDRITNLFSPQEVITGFTIGQEVTLSGLLQADGDLISYTHTLTLADASLVGIKSRTIDLGLYTGFVEVQGTVEKEFNSIFIIEVSMLSGTLASTWIVDETLLWSGSGIYISQAALYLPAEFWTNYTLLNQGENGVLKVKNISTSQTISVSYFACKTSDPNKNCTQLQQNISASAEKTVSTSRGDTLYKLEWVTSWYFNNGNSYGYFINDVPEDEVINLVNAMILPNEYYVKNTLLSKLQTLCTDGTTSLMQVTTYSLGVDLNGLILNLAWPTDVGSAVCKVFIDPSQTAGGTKISYVSNTPTAVVVDTGVTNSTWSVVIDASVTQFPINLEKTLIFTSTTRWYSITFPSRNIAYETVNIDEALDLPGVRCSTQMNVVKYSDKALLASDPKVKIFMCTIQGTLNNLWNSIIQKTNLTGDNFLIQIVDPSWAQFANNIQIN